MSACNEYAIFLAHSRSPGYTPPRPVNLLNGLKLTMSHNNSISEDCLIHMNVIDGN